MRYMHKVFPAAFGKLEDREDRSGHLNNRAPKSLLLQLLTGCD